MPGKPTQSTFPPEDPIERTIRAATVADVGPEPEGEPPPAGSGYVLGKQLGQGGEGVVHEAVQEAFGRTVAVKTMHVAGPGKRRLRRFRAEAAITALLEHPAIIPVHDLRIGADGRPQLVMKRVSGKTWRHLLDGAPGPLKRPLTGEEHVEVLLKVCDALAFAHSRGVLHRDLKPENVMVGEHGEVLVMDWGCAVHMGPQAPHPDIPLLSEMHGVSGTPAYLSPEQARADHAACGPWSDVYLLGAVLYRMLTGEPPHQGEDITATIAVAARSAQAPDPRGTVAGIKAPPELARIAVDAMHPDPAKRIRSAGDFALAVRRYLEHREVHRLLAEAHRQHELARGGGPDGDDAYRRAISAVEQAVALWPEHVEGRRMFVEVGMDSARHAIAAGAFRIARRQAQSAAAEAERLGDGAAVDNAHRLAGIADMRERQTKGREAKLATMRKLATGGAVVAGLAMLVGLLAVWRESSATAHALADARTNLEKFESERQAREQGEKLAAPALLAQAREVAAARKLPDALALVQAAQGFAPDDPAAWLMAGQLLAAQGKREEAARSLDRAIELRNDKLADELRQLCRSPPADADLRLADVLVRMGAGAMAGALNLKVEQRAEVARQHLARVWPKLPPRALTGLPDGTLSLALYNAMLPVDSLEPLRGMPISQLDLGNQTKLRDLAPLASLPLTQLNLAGVHADTGPVYGLQLKRLTAPGTELKDLGRLRGMPLEVLELDLPGVASLAPLGRLPLQELRLHECDQLSDISVLNLLKVEVLALDAPPEGAAALTDLGPLRGKQLRSLSLSNQRGVASLAPLRGMPLASVAINGTGVTDLKPIVGPALKTLDLTDAAVEDLRPLLTSGALEVLRLSPQRIKSGLAELPKIASLRSVNGLAPADFLRWVELQRALLTANPEYTWDATAVYDGGKLVEVRLPRGIRSLEALRGSPLRLLVAPNCHATDLAALVGMPLTHLELPYSRVRDLTPLAGITTLRTLHLAFTPVTDLRPLAKLQLHHFTFPPGAVTQGLDVIRRMSSLEQAGISPNRLLPIRDFWVGVDRGDLK